jgi:hypothetical protein
MAIIVTYDVPDKHVEIKKALFALGYKDRIPHKDENGVDRIIYLPNTTVYHISKTAVQGREEVKAICGKLNTKLERCVATQWGPEWAAIYGEPFK